MAKITARHLVLLIVVLNGVFFLVQLAMMKNSLSDGTYFRANGNTNAWQGRGAVVTVIDSTQNALQDGDLILEVASHPLSTWVERLLCFSGSCDAPPSPAIRNGTELTYTIEREGTTQVVTATMRPYPFRQVLARSPGSVTVAIVTYLMFVVLFLKRPDEPSIGAMALMASGFLVALRWNFGLSVADLFDPVMFWSYRVATGIFYMLAGAAFIHFALVFPKPLPIVRRHPGLVVLPYAAIYLLYGTLLLIYFASTSNRLLWLAHANTVSTVIDSFTSISALLGIILAYRSLTQERERRQVWMVIFSVVLVMAFAIVLLQIPQFLFGTVLISQDQFAFVGLLIPITIAISIQRYRLWAIDPIVNRTLVYLGLSAIVIALYMVVVAATGAFLRTQTTPMNGLIAAGVVAVVFQPLRNRMQTAVDRLMYGERDDPAGVLFRLAYHLETADAPDAILPNLVQTIAQSLKLPYVAIYESGADDLVNAVASWGRPQEQLEMIPLVYQNQTMGYLAAAPRGLGEQFTANERMLLTTIAALTATTVRAVRLSDELRQSRQRIVAAREEERRRIRRDLHDGLGPQLASQSLGLEAVAQLMSNNPDRTRSLLESLQTQTHEAILDVRRLVYDLRPPALDDLGLVDALKQSARLLETGRFHVLFDVSEMRAHLPAAVETAVFRIAQEAMTNVVRHARASRCVVRLSRTERAFVVEIEDDGQGLPAEYRLGVGLRAMTERAAELNGRTVIERLPAGGTLVRARFPLEVEDA